MNCPSRVDENFLHPDWNQNPPFLAPDITTRQDLDGIANSREHKYDELGSGNAINGSGDAFLPQFYEHSDKIDLPSPPRREGSPLKDVPNSFKGQLTSRLELTTYGLEPRLQSKPASSWSLGSGIFFSLINGAMLCAHYGLFSRSDNQTLAKREFISYCPSPYNLYHLILHTQPCPYLPRHISSRKEIHAMMDLEKTTTTFRSTSAQSLSFSSSLVAPVLFHSWL